MAAASADITHPFEMSFGTGQLGQARAVAVDQTTGDVYVSDVFESNVRKYDDAGAPADFSALGSNALGPFSFDYLSSQLAVDDSGGANDRHLYVTNSSGGGLQAFQPSGAPANFAASAPYLATNTISGSPAGAFGKACGVAVDADGTIYVADGSAATIYVFAPSGAYLTSAVAPAEVCGIAVDSLGNLYASSYYGNVNLIQPSSFPVTAATTFTAPTEVAAAPAVAITVDPVSDELYVDRESFVSQYEAAAAGNAPLGSFGSGQLNSSLGLALDRSGGVNDGDLFAADVDQVKRLGAAVTVPGSVTAPASAVSVGKATLNGTVNPSGLAVTECKFEYGLTEALGSFVPCAESPGSIGSGTAPVSVHVDLIGLDSGAYHFRLQASNGNGSTRGATEVASVPGAPVIVSQSEGSEATRASLVARIDPNNRETRFHFEYGPTANYGQSTEEEAVAAQNDPVKVAQQIVGLAPSTTYHYRLVAVNDIAEVKGPDRTFVTDAGSQACPNAPVRSEQGSIYLPECRAYELVSPADKVGGGVFNPFNYSATAAAEDGSRATFQSQNSFADAAGAPTLNDYVSQRGPGGWSTHAITSKEYRGGNGSPVLSAGAFSTDLTKAVLLTPSGEPPNPLAPGASPGQGNLFLNDILAGTYRTLTPDSGTGPFAPDLNFNELRLVVGADDLSTVAYEDTVPHTDNAPAGVVSVYAWHEGQVDLVSTLPNGQPATAGAFLGAGSEQGQHRTVSADGSRIFFGTSDGRLYVRKDWSSTVEVSASQKPIPDSPQPAKFRTASRDGRYVFFTTEEQLLPGDTNTVSDLYRYDVDTDDLILISVGATNPESIGVWSVAGSSDDGSYVYFTAVFADYGGPHPSVPNEVFELYVWHDGQIDYIGSGGGDEEGTSTGGRMSVAEVAVDGTTFAFRTGSAQLLTGEEPQPDQSAQIYVYDAITKSLRCASCRHDGKANDSGATMPSFMMHTKLREQLAVFDMQALSADGKRVFFNTALPLVAADTNKKVDAYEYVNGRQYLISSGRSEFDSFFVNASADGGTAFFSTLEPLVRSDPDKNIDLYAARVNGGFSEPPPTIPCAGEACKTSPTSPPPPTGAGSAQFSGSGNVDGRAQQKAKHKKQKKKARKHKKKKRASKSKGASKRSVGK